MIIFAFIPCPGENFCSRPYDYIEAPILAIKELVKPIGVLFCALGIIVSIAFFNFLGVSVTKYSSVSHRAVVDTSRTVVVWIFFLALGNETFLGLQVDTYANYVLIYLARWIYHPNFRITHLQLSAKTTILRP